MRARAQAGTTDRPRARACARERSQCHRLKETYTHGHKLLAVFFSKFFFYETSGKTTGRRTKGAFPNFWLQGGRAEEEEEEEEKEEQQLSLTEVDPRRTSATARRRSRKNREREREGERESEKVFASCANLHVFHAMLQRV